jgi:hypothetical protein
MADQTADDMSLAAETSGCQAQMLLEISQVRAAHVPEFHILEVSPDALIRVKSGGVARQLLEAQAPGRTLGQEFFDGLTAMNRRTVPDHQQLAGDVSQQMLEEADHLGAIERVVLHAQQQSAARGDAADGGQVVTGEREAQRWRVAAWREAADHRGQQGKARFDAPLSNLLRDRFGDREHVAFSVLLIECECFGLLVSRDPYHIAHEREGSAFGCVVMNERASIESA